MTPEQPDERERAEQFAGWVRSTNPTEAQIIEQYVAFAREERARVWEEAADRVGPHDDLYFEWRLKATALREEGVKT